VSEGRGAEAANRHEDTMTSTKTVTVRNAFTCERGTYRATGSTDGTVRVYDSVAGYYPTAHALTPRQIASARRRAV
jgi:hypothetical protein